MLRVPEVIRDLRHIDSYDRGAAVQTAGIFRSRCRCPAALFRVVAAGTIRPHLSCRAVSGERGSYLWQANRLYGRRVLEVYRASRSQTSGVT